AISVARATAKLAFSIYRDGKYEIYVIDSSERLAGGPLVNIGRNAGVLPPRERPSGLVAGLLQRSEVGLTAAQGKVVDYSPRLQLDYVGQPYLVTGADRFGTYLGGGVSFLMSDMLGNHEVGIVAQVNGQFDELGGQIGYLNRESRWNWGSVAEWIPYRTGGFSTRLGTVNDEPAVIEDVISFTQTHRQVGGVVAYPFNRSHRVEFTGGFRSIGFKNKIESRAFSRRTGQLIAEQKQDLEAPDSLNFGEASAALVYDTSILGPTSPLLGRRYRLEVAPSIGGLNFSGLLADYRQYFMPFRPYTIAGRLLHFGRYGGDAEDLRLTPLFVGYPTLVRGYDLDSFTVSECRPTGTSPCPVFDQLIGSRVLIGNLELRFPVVGAFRGEINYGPVPVEGILFADAGVAWSKGDEPEFLGGSRKVVKSVGAGIRVNALGFAVIELSAARPLDRPGKGWLFTFSFAPGF
ncbi:MAG: hypothetical protein ACRD1T_05860, partial [Acidimicrobiia bacterium]